jgi:hypothetical protein
MHFTPLYTDSDVIMYILNKLKLGCKIEKFTTFYREIQSAECVKIKTIMERMILLSPGIGL